jgi:hypothetical protein
MLRQIPLKVTQYHPHLKKFLTSLTDPILLDLLPNAPLKTYAFFRVPWFVFRIDGFFFHRTHLMDHRPKFKVTSAHEG